MFDRACRVNRQGWVCSAQPCSLGLRVNPFKRYFICHYFNHTSMLVIFSPIHLNGHKGWVQWIIVGGQSMPTARMRAHGVSWVPSTRVAEDLHGTLSMRSPVLAATRAPSTSTITQTTRLFLAFWMKRSNSRRPRQMLELPAHYPSLTSDQRRLVRNRYVAIQYGLCAHCGGHLDGEPSPEAAKMRVSKWLFPENMFKYPVHLHHCHKTGLTIGAVHAHCNAVLWEHFGE